MNIKILSSALVVVFIFDVANTTNITKSEIDDIESLIESLENAKIDNNVEAVKEAVKQAEQPTINRAVQQLVSAFQQYINAHITVLTGITRRLNTRRSARPNNVDYLQSIIGLKQLEENIEQFQETVSEFAKQINGIMTRGGPPNGNVAFDQLTKFIALWQKQIRDVNNQLTKAIGGLQADDSNSTITVPTNTNTAGNPVLDLFQQIFGVFQNAFQRLRDQFSRLFPINHYLENQIPSEQIQLDALNQIQKTLDNFQTEYQPLYEKLSKVLNSAKESFKNDGKVLADDSNEGSQTQVIGLKQIQQLIDTFQKQLATLVGQLSNAFVGQSPP